MAESHVTEIRGGSRQTPKDTVYAYVNGDPVSWLDPWGLQGQESGEDKKGETLPQEDKVKCQHGLKQVNLIKRGFWFRIKQT